MAEEEQAHAQECFLCEADIGTTIALCTLNCGHQVHTNCVMAQLRDDVIRAFNGCPICNAPAYDWEVQRAIHIARRQEEEEKMYTAVIHAEGAVQDLKPIKKQIALTTKKKKLYRSFYSQKMRQYKEETEAIRNLLKSIGKKYADELSQSTQYKELTSERKRLTMLIRRFDHKYTNRVFRFQSLLGLRKLRLPKPWVFRQIQSSGWWERRHRRLYRI